MLTVIKEKLTMIIVFIVFYLVIEVLTLHNLGMGFFPDYLILDILIVIFIGTIILFIKSRIFSQIYLIFWIILFNILYVTNITMNNIFGDIFSLEKLFLVSEANEVFSWSFISFKLVFIGIIITLAFISCMTIINKLFKSKRAKVKNYYQKSFLIILISWIFVLNSFILSNYYIKNQLKINNESFPEAFYLTTLKKSAFKHFGMLTFYYKEIDLHFIDTNEDNVVISQDVDKTKYHGLLKGKNVITIMIESGQEFGINPYLTPNLYRIQEEGLHFTENISVNKTNISEQIGIAGNYPTITSEQTSLPFSLPNILKDNYLTSYFHDNNGNFYNRDTSLKHLGFEKIFLHDDLFYERLPNWQDGWRWCGDYTLDSITIERILPYMINDHENFYSFWTTLSTHGPYNDNDRSNRDLFIKNGYFKRIDEVEEKGFWQNPLSHDQEGSFQYKYYQAAMIDLDIAIGKIINELNQKNILEDTILIIYGDHHVYYHDLHLRINNLTASEYYKMDKLYDSILYIWNPLLNETIKNDFGSTKIDTFTSPYIIVPTLLDLLGESYYSDWYLDYSVFSKNYIPVFYSHQLNSLMDNTLYTVDVDEITYQVKKLQQQERADFQLNCLLILRRLNKINKLY
jgi:phosphoglycerol transferase MdoB-like AlkP superfamily enzyme